MGKPERKTTDVVVAQKRPGKGTARNRSTLGERYFNSDKMVAEV
jgi:aconitase A